MPSGFSASAASAVVFAGTTVTLQPAVDQAAQDVALGAVVEGDDVEVASARRAAAVARIERGHAPLRRATP